MISPSLIMLWKFIGTDNGNESYIKKNLSDYYQTDSRNYDPELGRCINTYRYSLPFRQRNLQSHQNKSNTRKFI